MALFKTKTTTSSLSSPIVSMPAIYVDLSRCIGCNACSLACKQENNVQIGERWNEVYGSERGSNPSLQVRVLPMLCHHCEKAPCKSTCDNLGYRAIVKRRDGILYIDSTLCVGCQKCLPACPYQVIFFNPEKVNRTGGKGVAEKCHFCMHRIDAGLPPACVITCLGITREYGDYNALRAKYPEAKKMGGNVRILYGHLGDEPEKDGTTSGYPSPMEFHH